ncbi:MAG: iron uptake system protein EfeO [Aestuariivirga sp.]
MTFQQIKTIILAGVALPIFSMGVAFAADPAPTEITITDKGCEPSSVKLAAGPVAFKIINKSSRALEWEVLSGVNLVFERENILPGFTQDIKAKLDPGTYQMTCGLRTNVTGTLVAEGEVEAKPVAVQDFVGPLAEYKVYVLAEINELVDKTTKFTAAVKGGKLEDAQALYAQTRVHYERVEPVAELFGDLDPAIDARADDFEKKEQDPTFTGFHRIEYGLFTEKKTDGMDAVADKLMADVNELQARVKALVIPPDKMLDGAAALIEEVSNSKISGEEDRYSGTDLYDFQANVDGAMKIVELVRPLLKVHKPDLLEKTDANFAKVDELLKKYRVGDNDFKKYSELTDADRTALKGPITTLAEDLSSLKGALGFQ